MEWKPIDYREKLLNILDALEINVAALIMWSIWNFRNQSKLKGNRAVEQQLIRDIEARMEELNSRVNSNLASFKTENQSCHSRWNPPSRSV